jgi:large subunit ribosomal protein L18
MITKKARRNKIKLRIRKKINGTPEKPRLCVFRSNAEIYAQVINDANGHTVLSVSSLKLKDIKGTKSEVAKQVGVRVAQAAIEAGIKDVVFDRNGYLYHGRVKALAEGAREGGLQF